MFVVLLRYTGELERIDTFVEEHRTFLRKYYDAGRFIASGPMNPREGGVILAHAESKEQLSVIISEDPFYREQIATYEIIAFEPTMHRHEFEPIKWFLQEK
ncbi:uncharacterized protein YciI [Paenibacillus taihuensis]|uniref:Uncharacterized protein YciI n=1 Tax=Paenibacillus taihuensis TaxID=1156355 RepID=A0A3D9R0I6_9BACL|nr:YciI family protein [Paenibacillus taihuensis]REE67342.1 uncharacterized protein YciI [Paenibacillus taihuensis]